MNDQNKNFLQIEWCKRPLLRIEWCNCSPWPGLLQRRRSMGSLDWIFASNNFLLKNYSLWNACKNSQGNFGFKMIQVQLRGYTVLRYVERSNLKPKCFSMNLTKKLMTWGGSWSYQNVCTLGDNRSGNKHKLHVFTDSHSAVWLMIIIMHDGGTFLGTIKRHP